MKIVASREVCRPKGSVYSSQSPMTDHCKRHALELDQQAYLPCPEYTVNHKQDGVRHMNLLELAYANTSA